MNNIIKEQVHKIYNPVISSAAANDDTVPLIHKAAYIFPEMQEHEFKELKFDIRENGLKVPILLYQGKVIDGRHRLRACQELGITPKFEHLPEASNDAIEKTVVSINLHRRHLSEAQRSLIAARISTTSLGSNQHTAGAVSQKQAAAELGVSIDSIQRAKKVLVNGSSELIEALQTGKLDVSNAAKLADLTKENQSLLNFDDIKTILEVSKAINKAKFANRRETRLQAIEAKRANNKPLHEGLGNFGVLYVDPPWNYLSELSVGYPCMELNEICDMPVPDISAEDAVLFLWCSSSLLNEALTVIKAWGFEFKTSAVWDKGVAGQGAYFRQAHEVLMIATKGKIPEVPYDARPSSVLKFPRREHSRKPHELYQLIDGMYPELNKIELFCRGEPAKGWIGWGNECTQEPVAMNKLKSA